MNLRAAHLSRAEKNDQRHDSLQQNPRMTDWPILQCVAGTQYSRCVGRSQATLGISRAWHPRQHFSCLAALRLARGSMALSVPLLRRPICQSLLVDAVHIKRPEGVRLRGRPRGW